MYENPKTNIKKMLFLTRTSPRIKRDPERLVENEVMYFVQVVDFQCVIVNKAILSFAVNSCISFNVSCIYGGVIT